MEMQMQGLIAKELDSVVSSAIFYNRSEVYQRRVIKSLLDKEFIYVLFDKDKPIYVGKSTSVMRRIRQHKDKPFTHFYIFESEDKICRIKYEYYKKELIATIYWDAGYLENLLIQYFKPPLNKIRYYRKKSYFDGDFVSMRKATQEEIIEFKTNKRVLCRNFDKYLQ